MPNTTAESKARQRDRNTASGGPGTRSGASGAGQLIAHMQRKEFEDIEAQSIDGPGFAGQVTDVMMLANRDYKVSMVVPAAYAYELVDLGQDSATMFTFFRTSHVPRRAMLPERSDEDGAGDGDE